MGGRRDRSRGQFAFEPLFQSGETGEGVIGLTANCGEVEAVPVEFGLGEDRGGGTEVWLLLFDGATTTRRLGEDEIDAEL